MNPSGQAASAAPQTAGSRSPPSITNEPRIPRFSVQYMDRSVDPRKDFYQFATGTWVRENPVPADKSRWGSFSELTERNFFLIRELLEGCANASGADATPLRRFVGDFYASAMETERLEELRLAPIRADLAAIAALDSVEALVRQAARFHREGISGLFESFAYPDKRDSSVYAFYLVQGGLSLPDREYYLKEEFAEVAAAFRATVAKSFGFLGWSPADAEAAAATVFSVESKLALASRSRTELRDEEKNYHKVTVDELARRDPRTPWRSYLVARELPPLDHVIVGQPEFFDSLDHLLHEYPLSDWKIYLTWQFYHASAPFLHAEAEDEDFAFFHKVLLGQPEPEPRWLRSAKVLDAAVGEAVGRLYVERYFPPEARARMAELVGDLRAVFRERLAKLPWMTEATRRKALAKFDRFTPKIGHPDVFRDYSSVRIDRSDYLGNYRRAAAFDVHRQIVRVGGPVDRTEWGMTPPQVNAYFDPTKNEIVFPAGILQPPFFDLALDDAVNYGGIGAVIGHEITHGYDDQGRKYGPDGNLEDWWSEADASEFNHRAKAVVEEYNSYEALPGVHVNGELTLGENIADIGGVSIAFEALQRRLAADPSRRKVVDGLTPEQRFFISFAQIWRLNIREPDLRFRLTVDPHSQGRFRVLCPCSNLPAFSEAFGIRPDDPMWRPDDRRISIW